MQEVQSRLYQSMEEMVTSFFPEQLNKVDLMMRTVARETNERFRQLEADKMERANAVTAMEAKLQRQESQIFELVELYQQGPRNSSAGDGARNGVAASSLELGHLREAIAENRLSIDKLWEELRRVSGSQRQELELRLMETRRLASEEAAKVARRESEEYFKTRGAPTQDSGASGVVMGAAIHSLRSEMATKDDLALAKDDIAVKVAEAEAASLARIKEQIRVEFATKEEIASAHQAESVARIKEQLRAEFATKEDLARGREAESAVRVNEQIRAEFATKDELASVRKASWEEAQRRHEQVKDEIATTRAEGYRNTVPPAELAELREELFALRSAAKANNERMDAISANMGKVSEHLRTTVDRSEKRKKSLEAEVANVSAMIQAQTDADLNQGLAGERAARALDVGKLREELNSTRSALMRADDDIRALCRSSMGQGEAGLQGLREEINLERRTRFNDIEELRRDFKEELQHVDLSGEGSPSPASQGPSRAQRAALELEAQSMRELSRKDNKTPGCYPNLCSRKKQQQRA